MTSSTETKTTHGKRIADLKPGVFNTLVKVAPCGSLQVRKHLSNGVSFYWRFSDGEGSQRVLIGAYDPVASPKSLTKTERGFSVSAAIRAAEVLAQEHYQNRDQGGRRALVAARNDAKVQADTARQEAAQNTLQKLLDDYCDHLKALERPSHKDARSIFKCHVTDAWPSIASCPANLVTVEQVADMMRKVHDAGKGRTANKLRSYLGAAYKTARAARSKASVPLHFKAYRVSNNPAADTEPDPSQNKADRDPLSLDELRTYWNAIKRLPEIKGALLRLHLLTGGQRIEQLVNLLTANVMGDRIMIYDSKGRPGKAIREHSVPLIEEAAKALAQCKPTSTYALSTNGGVTHVAATTLSAWAAEVATGIPRFKAKRIRSGIETLLASVGVSNEIRGRLQSHGVTGLQTTHYNAHDYMMEKRQALETIFRLLNEKKSANVTNIKSKQRA